MAKRGPWLGGAALAAFVVVGVAVGGMFGVGPLGQLTPAAQVTDPREMIARSLQSTLDATSVHLQATVTGTIPGRLRRPARGGRHAGRHHRRGRPAAEGRRTGPPRQPGAWRRRSTAITVWDGVWYRAVASRSLVKCASLGARRRRAPAWTSKPADPRRPAAVLPRPAPISRAHRDGHRLLSAPPGDATTIVLDAGTGPGSRILSGLCSRTMARPSRPSVSTTLTLNWDPDDAAAGPTSSSSSAATTARSTSGVVVDASRWDEDSRHRGAALRAREDRRTLVWAGESHPRRPAREASSSPHR